MGKNIILFLCSSKLIQPNYFKIHFLWVILSALPDNEGIFYSGLQADGRKMLARGAKKTDG